MPSSPHNHWRANRRPAIQQPRIADPHIHTAMTSRPAKVVVPIRAVDGVATSPKEHHVRHVRQIVARAAHAHLPVLGEDAEPPTRCGRVPNTSGDRHRHHHAATLPRCEALICQADLDPLAASRCQGAAGRNILAAQHRHKQRHRYHSPVPSHGQLDFTQAAAVGL